uniref:Pre-B-cell leukemia homeobox interacting protein 1b n=1 Tax=Tetraodon nigroviridis TaxID=99883 RepID=H3DLV2_TETNG
GFSVNKCILAALILLGLGTIFFSGKYRLQFTGNADRDEVCASAASDLTVTQPCRRGRQVLAEWLNTEVPQTDAETTELLKQLARGSQQVSELQTQLQAQAEELKAAKGLAEEGAKERLQWGEVEKENTLQRELETLRATVTEFKLSTAPNELPDTDSTAPPSGHAEDGAQGAAEFTGKEKAGDEQRIKDKDQDPNKKHKGMDEEKTREKPDWMEGGKKSGYGGKAEWEKFSEDKYKKGKKMYQKDSASRGEEGKPWKDGKGEKRWEEKTERKESKRPSDAEWKTGTDDKKDERKERGERKHAEKKRDGKNDWQPWEQGRPTKRKDRDGTPFQRDAPEFPGHHEAKQGGRGPPQRRAPLEQPQYWLQQRTRLQRNPRPPQRCHSVETCAHDEGLPPVPWGEFQAVLQTYLARAQEVGVDASAREELRKLATEFFRDGVFVHDQMRFQDFLKDLGDVLEDMVEGEDDDDEEDSHIED